MHRSILIPGILLSACALAGEVEILDARARADDPGSYRFDVTLRHQDTGWQHYADGWEVLTMDGRLLGSRTLYHPHVNEQPFTRSLGGVEIPSGTGRVQIRAHDTVHGYSRHNFLLKLHP